ncbi:MAG: hypothetical protein LUE12_05415 [Ruminococcus sp.]|nr:hypothetical protein [Ruminococcus sp.]
MPKQIKTKPVSKLEKTNRILAIFAMLADFAFTATLLVLLYVLGEEDYESKLGIAVFGTYFLMLVLCAIHCIQGAVVFKKEERYGVLFQSIVTGASAFALLLNVQLISAMLFTSLGKDSWTQKVIGESTYSEFIEAQQSAWQLLILALAAVIVIGIAGIVRLAVKKR